MACQNQAYVLLGFQDEYISEKNQNFTDFTTNKIGGKPDWCQATNIPLTQCRLCGANLPLLVQIYAPLDGSKYHRTLYIFACIQPMCWNRSESWLCVRQQVLASSKVESSVVEASSSVSFWHEEADNWDSEEEQVIPSVDQENGNIVIHRPLHQHRIQEDTDTDDSTASIEEASDPNANSGSADEGAFAVEFQNKVHIATAEIEIGDESDIVSIDTPTRPQCVAELFVQQQQRGGRAHLILHPEFVSSFIAVAEEVTATSKSKLTEHELALLQQYQQSELGGGDIDLNGRLRVEAGAGSELTSEQYEKEVPTHGDLLAHRFISRLQHAPGQILRYGRSTDPLLLLPLPKQQQQQQRCPHCGGDLVFELQLLPALLAHLSLSPSCGDERRAADTGLLEFGTALIYTCEQACWSSSDEPAFREEKLVIQAEAV